MATNRGDLKSKPSRATLIAQRAQSAIAGDHEVGAKRPRMFTDRPLTATDLARIERQLLPLLNSVRLLQGKRPVIVPGEKRIRAAE